jgi:phospholipid-binding lipoprotein MlaA
MGFSSDTGRASAWLIILVSVSVLSACVSQEQMAAENSGYVEYDPLEPLNRKIHSFNMAADRAILRPVARGYRKVVPAPVRTSVTNFFSNLRTPGSALNNFLQGKPKRGFSELGRFLFNSTLGLGGLFDVAGKAGLERYDENFAETLSVWGVPDGPYIVIPFWGPNMMSDAVALPVDYYSDVWTYYDNSSVRDKVWGLRLVDLRYRVLAADAILDESQDTYVTVREAFRQNRRFRVFDGDPPTGQEEEDFYEDELFDEFFDDEEEVEATDSDAGN